MSFEIDTGPTLSPVRQMVPDFLQDWYPDATDEQLTMRYCQYLMGEMREPKKVETCRKRLMANWTFIRHALNVCPEYVDEILTEYVERTQSAD
jgi:hypothetical protein